MENILNLVDYNNPLELGSFFGKDSKKLFKACKKVKNDWLHPYEGCYMANYSRLHELQKMLVIPEGSTFGKECKAFLKEWYQNNPDEKEKEEDSKKKWEVMRARSFRVVYGIARRHGCYIVWHGNDASSCGNQWTIYKGHESVARIYT